MASASTPSRSVLARALLRSATSRPVATCPMQLHQSLRAAAASSSSSSSFSQGHRSRAMSTAAVAASPLQSRGTRRPRAHALARTPQHPSTAAAARRTIFIQTEPTPNSDALKFVPNHRVLPEGFAASPLQSRGTRRPRAHALARTPQHPSTAAAARRTIFIQTEPTPNSDALKFVPNHRVLPEGFAAPFVEYTSPRATIAPPHPSPLAAKLMNIDGVTSVFYGADFITITKASDANWAHIRPEIFALITEAITSGETIVTFKEAPAGAGAAPAEEQADSLAYDEDDDEVVGMIKELLETRIRPAIQEDGGDIEFRGFGEDGFVNLKLRGACRTCDSSTVTLRNGIEGMLMHYIEEVKGVRQVLDEEEEISLQEFAKFEEKLKQQKGVAQSA